MRRNPLTGRPMNTEGCDWYTVGAQKGIAQPPYVVRLRGKWYRTLPLSQPVDCGPSMDAETKAAIDAMPHLEFGARRCLDYLERTRKHFADLPLWTADQRGA